MKGFGLQSTDCDTAGKVGRRVFKLLRGAHGFWRIRLTLMGPSGPRLRFWPYQRSCGLVVKKRKEKKKSSGGQGVWTCTSELEVKSPWSKPS